MSNLTIKKQEFLAQVDWDYSLLNTLEESDFFANIAHFDKESQLDNMGQTKTC